jgi:hypothetical protein
MATPNQIIVADRLMSEQDAVNAILRSVGMTVTSSVLDTNNRSAQMAAGFLYEQDLAVQSKGWSWNTSWNVALAPDNTGKITLPATLMSAQPTAEGWSDNVVYRTGYQLAQRGEYLYNVSLSTFLFDGPVSLDLVQRLPWDSLPVAARVYITALAALRMNASTLESARVERALSSTAQQALFTLSQTENKWRRANQKGNRGSVFRIVNGRGGRRRNRTLR